MSDIRISVQELGLRPERYLVAAGKGRIRSKVRRTWHVPKQCASLPTIKCHTVMRHGSWASVMRKWAGGI